MNVTATLFGQMITFLILIWFVSHFLWKPMIRALAARQERIAEGLAASERGKQEQKLAEVKATETLKAAKMEATEIISKAQKRAAEVIEEAKLQAVKEAERIQVLAQEQLAVEVSQTKQELRKEVAGLALVMAEKILQKEVNPEVHQVILSDFQGKF